MSVYFVADNICHKIYRHKYKFGAKTFLAISARYSKNGFLLQTYTDIYGLIYHFLS